MNRKQLDDAFPTVVRYTGWLLTLALVTASIFGVPLTLLASGYVAAAGMILFKTVKDAANGNGERGGPL